jgi:hypothetical protein
MNEEQKAVFQVLGVLRAVLVELSVPLWLVLIALPACLFIPKAKPPVGISAWEQGCS